MPVFCGAAFKNKGVQRLLDGVIHYLPSPVDLPPVIGKCLEGTEIERYPKDDGRMAALAFKVVADRHMGKLIYLRVYSGTMRAGSYVYNSVKGKRQRIGRLMQMHANHQEMRDAIYCGDIGAAVGLGETATGDTICDEEHPIVLEAIEFPAPVISVSITPESRPDQERLAKALHAMSEEDPTFIVAHNAETSETVISGMGELHLEIIVDRMRREFGVQAKVGVPQVAYRETITQRPWSSRTSTSSRPAGTGSTRTSSSSSSRSARARASSSWTRFSAARSRSTTSPPSSAASWTRWPRARTPAFRWWTCA